MDTLKKTLDYLIQKRYWVSLCAAGLARFVQGLSGSENRFKAPLVFFSTLVIYNLGKSSHWYVHQRKGKGWIPMRKRIKKTPIEILLSLIGVVISLFHIPLHAVYVLAPAFILGFFYTIPLCRSKSKYIPLRQLKGLKIFLIAISWGLAIGVFPLEDDSLGWRAFGLIALFVIGIGIPFDIRDLVRDAPQLKTLPQVLGETRAKALALLCLLGSYVFSCALDPPLAYELAYIASLSVAGFLIGYARVQRPNFYYSFWVEGCSLLPLLLSLMFSLWI